MTPSAIVEFGIKKNGLTIEMGDKGRIYLAFVDCPQNGNHWLGRLQVAHINVHGIRRSPHSGRPRRSRTSHDQAPFAFELKSVPQYLIIGYILLASRRAVNPLAIDPKARAETTGAALRVRRVQAADIPQVIALDTRVTKLAKPEYWNDVYRRYGKRRLHERFFLIAQNRLDRTDSRVLGFIIGEIRAWEFGSTPCGWVFALSVEPDMRLHGIGKALLEAISGEFRKAGVNKMRTMVERGAQLPLLFFRSEGLMAGPYIQLEKDLD